MSDPFQPAERRFAVTWVVLRHLAERAFPTVVSTRGSLVAEAPYLDLLSAMPFVVVQFSFSTSRDEIAKRLEPHSTPPSALLDAMGRLASAGVHVTCRWQPYVPGVSEAASEFAARVASTGCRHVALEHLKLPLERAHPLWQQLLRGAERDLHLDYRALGAVRDGREYVLPPERKLAVILQVAKAVRSHGMTFGAADNEFQFLSDTACCCSGVDQFEGFSTWFKHQVGYAVRSCRGIAITYDAIAKEWSPPGSVDRFLNSRSRLSPRFGLGGSIRDHVANRWNDPRAAGGPASYYGVEPTAELRGGHRVYRWASWVHWANGDADGAGKPTFSTAHSESSHGC